VHVLVHHVVPFVEQWKTLNYFSEQAIEHAHSVVKGWLRRIVNRDELDQMELIMQWAFERNIIYDMHEKLDDHVATKRNAPDTLFI
jgi:hypothetical protein